MTDWRFFLSYFWHNDKLYKFFAYRIFFMPNIIVDDAGKINKNRIHERKAIYLFAEGNCVWC